jgi:hypothetical protein
VGINAWEARNPSSDGTSHAEFARAVKTAHAPHFVPSATRLPLRRMPHRPLALRPGLATGLPFRGCEATGQEQLWIERPHGPSIQRLPRRSFALHSPKLLHDETYDTF